jgi:Kef-type K+ transport system membrane component KefB/mannitol/fructose-specific phosphotransferase system IIA component (Ntr-type)
MDLPLTQPILILALLGMLILAVPLAAQRLHIPATVALILAGLVAGPHGFHLLGRGGGLELFAAAGLLYIMFLAGLEIDLPEFRFQQRQALFLGLLAFGFCQLLGTVAGWCMGLGGLAAVVFGSLLAPQTLVTYPRVSRLGLARNPAVPVAVGAAALANALALFVLVASVRLANEQFTLAYVLRLGAGLGLLALVALFVLPRVGHWFYRRYAHDDVAEFLFLFVAFLAVAALAGWAGVEPVLGALVAGLALNPLVPEQSRLLNRVQFVGNALFVPMFLLSVGMMLDPRALVAGARVWLLTGVLLAGVVGAKYAAVRLTRRRFGFSPDQGLLQFGLMVNKASITVAAVLIAAPVLGGLAPPAELLNAVVFLVLVTCVLGGTLTERAARRLLRTRAAETCAGHGVPQRVLVPITAGAGAERLVSLALLLREPGSRQPLFPLGVAVDGPDVAGQVAELERLLSQVVVHAAAASVPVQPETRIDDSVAEGVARAGRELRASCIVLAWPAPAALAGRASLLRTTGGLVVYGRLEQPVNTFQRLLLVVPPLLEQASGFAEALRTVDNLASQAGLPLLVVSLRTELAQRLEAMRSLSPGRPVSGLPVEVWSALPDALARRGRPNDLLVLLSCREDSPTWQPALGPLPFTLAARFPQASLLLMFPAETPPTAMAGNASPAPAVELEDLLAPGQAALGVQATDFHAFLRQLLEPYLGAGGSGSAGDQAWLLAEALAGSALEVTRGTVLAHVHCGGIEAPVALLGTPAGALAVPGVAGPVQAVFVLLSPLSSPAAEHLRALADLARLIRHAPRLDELGRARSTAELRDLLAPPAETEAAAGAAAVPPP